MGTQGPGRKRHPNRERLSAEDHALNQIAREAEARLAAKRAARAEAREIRMKELERQQKEIYQVQKKYYGLDAKWGDIEQWMEDSERYSHRPRRNLQADEDDAMSVTSRSSLRTNGYEDELGGAPQYRKSSRSSTGSGETYQSSRGPPRNETTNAAYHSDLSLASAPLTSKPQQQSVHNGSRPSLLNCNTLPSRSQRGSLYDEGVGSGSRRSSNSRPPSEYSCYLGSGSRASSRASSARASPVSSEPTGSSMFRRGSNSASVPSLSHLDDGSLSAMSRVEERSDKDFGEKGGRPVSSLSAATLASLGGTSSRRGSGDTSISVDTEASIREIKDSLAEVEEKYKRSMVTNAQLDNEKSSLQYQVDTLREVLLELEEELAESRRQYEEKHKECERQKHDQNVLRFQLAEMKDALEQRESLLTEIRQLQQKQESDNREIVDLKETIEWKDKKIGALERQKEFFEPIRSERDTLREEVARLREELKKNGIALDSVDTPNGDSSVEPQVNVDGRPDPPVRTTSMGKSHEVEEKKEVMSVMGESPPSQTRQDEQEVLQDASSEKPLHAGTTDTVKEQVLDETDSIITEKVECGEVNMDHQGGGLHHDSEANITENEMDVEKSAHGNLSKEVLRKDFSETDVEAALNQRDSSPVSLIETEVFQDALDVVVQSPYATSKFKDDSPVPLADCTKESIGKQEDSTKEEGKCELQCTAINNNVDPKDVALEIAEQKEHNADDIPANKSEIFPCREHESEESCFSDFIKGGSEESSGQETVTPYDQHEELIKKEAELEVHSAPDGLGLRDSEGNVGETLAGNTRESTTVGIEADIKDADENKLGFGPDQTPQDTLLTKEGDIKADVDADTNGNKLGSTPEHSSQDTPVTKEHRLENEKSKSHEVQESSVLGSGVSTAENEAVKDNIAMEDSHQVQDEAITGVGLDSNTEKSQELKNLETAPLDAAGTELLDQGKTDPICDHLVCDENQEMNKNIPVFDENPKEPVRDERLSSEAESTTEKEESDENEDDDDGTERSEKYIGESLGSSVDQTSLDDIRMEDGSDKTARKGKGKNKEDCVLS
ncbi:leucine-rich repeat flightless-interacting protein 1 isoform X5 [Hyperolius riggenbachi]|uniref:leucine-rich repeat flightless-interacting protein 1 isoform X5 n=1 Tax=Hyperolius riggenbachi TaxID=752182 RepID=UPI0035A27F31